MNREIYNIVLVHTSREWERVRVTQPHQEMPYDNIGSVDEIESIASRIYYNDVMQGFIKAENRDEYWIKNTSEGMSDSYIESEANRIITEYTKDSEK